MTTTHTPGPWEDNEAGLIYGQVSGDDNAALFVCDVCNEPGSGEYTGQERANARLIAAAPEMLEALQSILEHDAEFAELEDFETMMVRVKEKARAAIAKATG